jgi:hypothetical protein
MDPLTQRIQKAVTSVTLAMIFGQLASAQEDLQEIPAIPQDTFGDEWTFVVSPYLWLLAIDGDARVAGVESDIDESFNDLLDNLSWMIEGRFEAYKGKWGFTLDLTYANLENDANVGPIEIESEVDIGLIYAGVNRELYRGPVRDDDVIKVEGNLGLGRTIVDIEFDSNVPALEVDSHQAWTDLLFGSRATWKFSDRRMVRLSGFVGGFELLGDSADFTAGVEGLYGWQFGKRRNWTLWGGYRWITIDYDPGNSFAMDVDISGPVAGLAFRW